jgi:hypothetical protein
MKSAFLAVFPLLFLGLPLASTWYAAARLSALFGWRSCWWPRTAVTIGLVASLVATIGAAVPAHWAVRLAYVAGGIALLAFVHLLLTLLPLVPSRDAVRQQVLAVRQHLADGSAPLAP